MDKQDIIKRISEIDNTVKALTSERVRLSTDLLKLTDNFIDKFLVWFNDESLGEHKDWVISKEKFPLLRAAVDDWDPYRHKTYCIEDIIGEDDFWAIEEPEEYIKDCGQEQYDKVIERITPLLKEAFEGNLKSFKYDW